MAPLDWLYHAAHVSIQFVSLSLWCVGCVIAIRRQPRPGASFAAAGFGILALQSLIAMVVYLTIVALTRSGTMPNNFSTIMLAVGSVQAIIHIGGILLLIVGVRQAWSTSWNDDLAILRPSETDDQSR